MITKYDLLYIVESEQLPKESPQNKFFNPQIYLNHILKNGTFSNSDILIEDILEKQKNNPEEFEFLINNYLISQNTQTIPGPNKILGLEDDLGTTIIQNFNFQQKENKFELTVYREYPKENYQGILIIGEVKIEVDL